MTVFEEIIKGTAHANKIYEDEEVVAFHDKDPQAPVHILVVPKTKCVNLQDANGEILCGLLKGVQAVAKKMKLDESGYRVIVNNGADAHQNIPYLHIHILGGKKLSKTIHHDFTHTAM